MVCGGFCQEALFEAKVLTCYLTPTSPFYVGNVQPVVVCRQLWAFKVDTGTAGLLGT